MYEYRCTVVKIIDGDTVDVDIDLGFGIWMHKERIRLLGIDTPESRTRDKEEKKYGLAAKKYLTEMLNDEGGIVLKTKKDAEGKFGRILGELWRTTDNAVFGRRTPCGAILRTVERRNRRTTFGE